MGAGSSAIVFGLFFLLLLGPALWLPSLLRWRIRTQSRRVRGLAGLLGEQGARICYIGLGIFVSLIGMAYIVSGTKSIIRSIGSPQPKRVDRGPVEPVATARPTVEPPRTIEDFPATRVFTGLYGMAYGLVFSPDGTRMMSAGPIFKLWDMETGMAVLGLDINGRKNFRFVQALASSRTCQFVVVALGDGNIHAERGAVGRIDWNAPLECETHFVPFNPKSVAISSDGRYALATSLEYHEKPVFAGFCLVDFQQGEVYEMTEPDDAVRVSFIGDTYQALIARTEGRLAVYDVESRTVVQEIEPPNRQSTGNCCAIGVSSDGKFAVTCYQFRDDNNNRLWDLQRGVYVERKTDQGTGPRVVFLAGNRSYAIGRFTEPTIDVYDRATGERTQTLSYPSKRGTPGIYALAISPNGKTIAATTRERCLIWDIAAEAP